LCCLYVSLTFSFIQLFGIWAARVSINTCTCTKDRPQRPIVVIEQTSKDHSKKHITADPERVIIRI